MATNFISYDIGLCSANGLALLLIEEEVRTQPIPRTPLYGKLSGGFYRLRR